MLLLIRVDQIIRLDTDDAYITYRYARNLIQGFGFTYNLGERVLGTSTPFYTLLLSIGGFLGYEIVTISRILNILCGGLVGSFTYIFVQKQTNNHPISIASSLILITSEHFLVYSIMGMETSLYIMLIMVVFILYDRGKYSITSFVVGLICLTRYDGFILVGALLLDYCIIERNSLKLKVMLPGFIAVLLWMVFALTYFGSPLPQSVIAKHHHTLISNRFWIIDFWTQHQNIYLLILIFLGLYEILRIKILSPGLRIILLWAIFYSLAFIIYSVDLYKWYLAPLSLVLATLPPICFHESINWKKKFLKGISSTTIHQIIIAFIAFGPVLYIQQQNVTSTIINNSQWTETVRVARGEIAKKIKENADDIAIIATGAVGVVGWETNAYIYDLMGIITPEAIGKNLDQMLRESEATWYISEVPNNINSFPKVEGFDLQETFFKEGMPMIFLLYKHQNGSGPPDIKYLYNELLEFDNGITFGNVQIGSKNVAVEVNLKNSIQETYYVFVHVLDQNSFEILRILDFAPSPPINQMGIFETYRLSTVFLEPIPEDSIIEIGIFNPAEINLPRLSTHSGKTSLILSYPPKYGDE